MIAVKHQGSWRLSLTALSSQVAGSITRAAGGSPSCCEQLLAAAGQLSAALSSLPSEKLGREIIARTALKPEHKQSINLNLHLEIHQRDHLFISISDNSNLYSLMIAL
jgi:hypothetical protein